MARISEQLLVVSAVLLACGGRFEPETADASMDASAERARDESDPCSGIWPPVSCDNAWGTPDWCGWAAPDDCAATKDAPPPPVPEAEVVRFQSERCVSMKPCNSDADCDPATTCRYIAVSCGSGPCVLQYPEDRCSYLHRCLYLDQ